MAARAIVGGVGNDVMEGGTGNDIFAFTAGFGTDRISDFDANPSGGRGLIDLTPFGLTPANFGTSPGPRVVITDVGADTLITIYGGTSVELVPWLHRYNWHRPHASLKAKPPISRLGFTEDNVLRLHS